VNKVLAKRDDSACLQRLLKYPPVENVVSIIGKAWEYLGISNNFFKFVQILIFFHLKYIIKILNSNFVQLIIFHLKYMKRD